MTGALASGVGQIGLRTLPDLWREQVQLRGDHPWLVFEDPQSNVSGYSYREFDVAVQETAAGLTELGVKQGDAVVLHLRNCPEFVMSWFALAQLGAVMAPSNVANTASELAYVVQHSHAVALVTSTEFEVLAEAVTSGCAGLTSVIVVAAPAAQSIATDAPPGPGDGNSAPEHRMRDHDAQATVAFEELRHRGEQALARDGAPQPARIRPRDVLQILFTSGTTAAPKGVMATHANAVWAGLSGAQGQGLDREDRCLTALPLFHVNGQAITVLSALTVGATMVLLQDFRPESYLDQLRRHQATQTSVVAQQALALLRQPESPADTDHRLHRMGFAINIPEDLKLAFERRFGVEFLNIYGLSEAMAVITMSPLHRPQRWPSVGLPALGRSVRILDPVGDDVEAGGIGEIAVSGEPGETVMLGYYEDPDATAAVMADGWVRTGDAGYLDEHGYLYFYERLKDVIKCSGQNVSATEVEACLQLHPDIDEAAVIGVPDERRGETVKAFVVLRPGAELTQQQAIVHCAGLLSRYKVPAFVEFRGALPRTSVGKLAKKLLRPSPA